MLKEQAIREHPAFPWLWLNEPGAIESFLRDRGWLEADETFLSAAKAGEGNMNLTLRVITNRRSIILKQARPWVEKYDFIEAPWDRLDFEVRFYQRIRTIAAVSSRMPKLLATDEKACALLLEDLGTARDLTSLYRGDTITREEIENLADYLAHLHAETCATDLSGFHNRCMRELNHAHIFVVPLAPVVGLDLEAFEPGLAAVAHQFHEDTGVADAMQELGQHYLADGPALLHGDFFPGSWLRTDRGLRVIDTEFCHAGMAEHDLGVALAHLSLARQAPSVLRGFLSEYQARRHQDSTDQSLIARFAGAEIIRRLIGVAQLPIPASTGLRAALLGTARRALLEGSIEPLGVAP